MPLTRPFPSFAPLGLASALVLVSATCAPSSGPGAASPTEGQMRTHFDLALELRQHAVAGELGAFRAASEALTDLEPTQDLPPEIFLQFGPLRYEARLGAEARTNEAAAQAAAEVARTCGDCHEANQVAVGVEAPRQRVAPGPDLEAHMDALSEVTRELWAGLVGPSDDAWMAGAEGLVQAGALPSGLAGRVGDIDLDFVNERLRRLGREAAAARRPADRVRALSEIWGTCSECHTEARGQ